MATVVTKMIKDQRFQMINTVLISGTRPVNSTENLIQNQVKAKAVFSRPRPPYPSSTPMDLTILRYNTARFRRYTAPGNVYSDIREGSIIFVYNTGGIRVIETENDGSFARNKALAKTAEFTFGETLAEAAETCNYVNKRITDLLRVGLALKRGDVRALERLFKDSIPRDAANRIRAWDASRRLAEGHLELMFGVLPIVNDISSAAKAYTQGLTTRGQGIRTQSGSTRTSGGISMTGMGNGGVMDAPASAVFRGRVRNTTQANLQRLGLLNVPLEAWNKLPFSFVFDWFIPVGTFLGGLTATAGLEDVDLCVTSSRLRTVVITWRGQDVAPQYQLLSASRRPILGFPLPSLDGLARSAAWNWGKVVTAAALARTQLLR